MFDSDQRIVLRTARDAAWRHPLTRLGLSVTTNSFRIRSGVACEKGLLVRAGVERARIVAQLCVHPSRVRSGLHMTRTILLIRRQFLSVLIPSHFFVAYTNSVNNVVAAEFATGAEFARWSSDLGLPVPS